MPEETANSPREILEDGFYNLKEEGCIKHMSLKPKVRPGVSKRKDFPLLPDRACLIVIDVQKYLSQSEEEQDDFFYRSVQTMTSNIPKLLKAFRTHRDSQSRGCEVIFTYLQSLTTDRRDISMDYKLSSPAFANIPNACTSVDDLFLDSVKPEVLIGKGDILIPKTSCSVFMSTNIDYLLRNLYCEQLVICGQLTDQCVESAVRDAADLGYFVTVVRDACAADSADSEAKGLKGMSGFCRALTTEQILEELKSYPFPSVPTHTSMESAKDLKSVDQNKESKRALGPTGEPDIFSSTREADYTSGLLKCLKAAGVEFLRYFSVDVCNTVRCKAAPLDQLMRRNTLNYQISIAKVCMAGLPSFADSVLEGTGLDARDMLIVQPDVATLRILPYAPKSALVMGLLHDSKMGGKLSELCTRGLLQKVTRVAREDYGLVFCTGAEIEFCLYDPLTNEPVDKSTFCNSTTLNHQEELICDLYNQLKKQEIPIEAIHAESAPGQLEVVINYQKDPVRMVDLVIVTQETIKAVCHLHSLKAVFLPKMYASQAGNGLHVHLSFTNLKNENAFGSINRLSDRGQSFVEGILEHLPGLLALTMPTTNSFRRMGSGCWTGSQAVWALEDKEAPLRICSNLHSQEWDHVEYKLSDSTGNLYLGLAAILASGLDGIGRVVALRPSRGELESQNSDYDTALPDSLSGSLDCLEKDELLTQLMGPTLSKSYIALRRAEAKRASSMTMEDELREALDRA